MGEKEEEEEISSFSPPRTKILATSLIPEHNYFLFSYKTYLSL